MKSILFILGLIISFPLLLCAESKCDSVRSVDYYSSINGGSHYRYLTGKIVYPQDTATQTISKIIKDNDIYLCMLKGEMSDSLIVLANIDLRHFSLGGPYEGLTKEIIRKKFSTCEYNLFDDDNLVDCDGDCDCPPFYYSIMMLHDTIIYTRSNKSHPFIFDSAIINDMRYGYRDLKKGKNIRNCKIGKLIPKSNVNGLKVIKFESFQTYIFWGNSKAIYLSKSVVVHLDNGIIENIYIY